LRDGAAAHERLFRNVSYEGRFLPNDEKFTIAIVDGKCRFDREVLLEGGARVDSHWLHDGEAAFSFSEDLLTIDPLLESRGDLLTQTGSRLWMMLMPDMGEGLQSVSDACDNLIDLVDKGMFAETDRSSSLEINDEGDEVVIELKLRDESNGLVVYHYTLALNREMGYVMTRSRDWQTADDGPEISLSVQSVNSTYREVAPGAYALDRGTYRRQLSGTRHGPSGDGRAGDAEMSVAIDAVEFGDFKVPDEFFSIHAWPPIKKGIKVDDSRVYPPQRYTYKEGPFEEAVLNRVVSQLPSSSSADRSATTIYLVLANAGILLFFAIWYQRQRKVAKE
jgi:hypothetical protein